MNCGIRKKALDHVWKERLLFEFNGTLFLNIGDEVSADLKNQYRSVIFVILESLQKLFIPLS